MQPVEVFKRDGRLEVYDSAKLARSLRRAGVAPHMIAKIVFRIALNMGNCTASIRDCAERELAIHARAAGERYSAARLIPVQGSEQAARDQVYLHPQTAEVLRLRPDGLLWLGLDHSCVPFRARLSGLIERYNLCLNQSWIVSAGIAVGSRIAASRLESVVSLTSACSVH